MSDISWFGDSPKESSEDLPWVKEYAEIGGDPMIPLKVERLYECPTGMLIFTEEWKGFVFKNSKLYKDLIEVIPDYLEAEELIPVMYTCANTQGKVSLGLQHNEVEAVWERHGKEYCQIYYEASTRLGRKRNTGNNPLSIPLGKNGKNKSKPPTPKNTQPTQ